MGSHDEKGGSGLPLGGGGSSTSTSPPSPSNTIRPRRITTQPSKSHQHQHQHHSNLTLQSGAAATASSDNSSLSTVSSPKSRALPSLSSINSTVTPFPLTTSYNTGTSYSSSAGQPIPATASTTSTSNRSNRIPPSIDTNQSNTTSHRQQTSTLQSPTSYTSPILSSSSSSLHPPSPSRTTTNSRTTGVISGSDQSGLKERRKSSLPVPAPSNTGFGVGSGSGSGISPSRQSFFPSTTSSALTYTEPSKATFSSSSSSNSGNAYRGKFIPRTVIADLEEKRKRSYTQGYQTQFHHSSMSSSNTSSSNGSGKRQRERTYPQDGPRERDRDRNGDGVDPLATATRIDIVEPDLLSFSDREGAGGGRSFIPSTPTFIESPQPHPHQYTTSSPPTQPPPSLSVYSTPNSSSFSLSGMVNNYRKSPRNPSTTIDPNNLLPLSRPVTPYMTPYESPSTTPQLGGNKSLGLGIAGGYLDNGYVSSTSTGTGMGPRTSSETNTTAAGGRGYQTTRAVEDSSADEYYGEDLSGGGDSDHPLISTNSSRVPKSGFWDWSTRGLSSLVNGSISTTGSTNTNKRQPIHSRDRERDSSISGTLSERHNSFGTARSSISAASGSISSSSGTTRVFITGDERVEGGDGFDEPELDLLGMTTSTSSLSTSTSSSSILSSLELKRTARTWKRWVGWTKRKLGISSYSTFSPSSSDSSMDYGALQFNSSGGSRTFNNNSNSNFSNLTMGSGRRRMVRRKRASTISHVDYGYGTLGTKGRIRVRKQGFPGNGFGLELPYGEGEGWEWVRVLASLIPVQPWSILLVLMFLAGFVASVTLSLMYILNPDKSPLPWRDYCLSPYPEIYALGSPDQRRSNVTEGSPTSPVISTNTLAPVDSSHPMWPHYGHEIPPYSVEDDSMDQLAPVGIFLGVFTTDSSRERRMVIRETYASHRNSRIPGTEGVRLRFVMGRPRPKYKQLVELEMEAYEDIVVLDIQENMNMGKTHAYFSWAAENATVPRWEYSSNLPAQQESTDNHHHHRHHHHSGGSHSSHESVLERRQFDGMFDVNELDSDAELESPRSDNKDTYDTTHNTQKSLKLVYRGERRPDYVVKADDDAFIMLGELESRLRVSPRKLTIWGYLVKNSFMAGECYALSYDLVQYVRESSAVRSLIRGKEDKLVARWMRMHPEREKVMWVSERCWIYDHPKSGTVYSHGYLFPSEVSEVRRENATALPAAEIELRGGKAWASTYSSVARFGSRYRPPTRGMTTPQQVEALVEGSEMSLLSRMTQDHELEKDLFPDLEDVFERRPTRRERFMYKPVQRGGTVLVHFIKRHDWFLETALALLGGTKDSDPPYREEDEVITKITSGESVGVGPRR